jgi:hypothetical protein
LSWQEFFNTFLILNDSIYLWFNFLDDRWILMFLMNNQIMSSILYADKNILCRFACFLCIFCALTNLCFVKFQISFIFSMMLAAFCVNNRFFVDNRSRKTSFVFDEC